MSEMKGSATIRVQAPTRYEDQDVVPAPSKAFESEPYLVINGWPKVPPLWVQGRSMTSSIGVFASPRDEPEDVVIDAHTRFIASGYDNVAAVWRPFQSFGSNYLWMAQIGLSPSTERVDYRLGKELLVRTGLRFNPGDYLFSNFNEGRDEALEFSIVLVLTPRVPAGYTIFTTQTDQDRLSLRLDNGFVLQYGDVSVSAPQSDLINVTPVYVVISVRGGTIQMWLGSSTRRILTRSLSIQQREIRNLSFLIGKSYEGKSTASMTMYEFLLFNESFDSDGAYEIISKLAYAYGSA